MTPPIPIPDRGRRNRRQVESDLVENDMDNTFRLPYLDPTGLDPRRPRTASNPAEGPSSMDTKHPRSFMIQDQKPSMAEIRELFLNQQTTLKKQGAALEELQKDSTRQKALLEGQRNMISQMSKTMTKQQSTIDEYVRALMDKQKTVEAQGEAILEHTKVLKEVKHAVENQEVTTKNLGVLAKDLQDAIMILSKASVDQENRIDEHDGELQQLQDVVKDQA